MRFLADESCDFAVVRALRAKGHVVTAVGEVAAGVPDERVIAMAVREGAVLLTEDKDFGQLVFAEQRAAAGVIFIRFPAMFRAELPQVVCHLVEQRGEKLVGSFVVVQPGRIRVAHRPRGGE
jgi:predicted nuclease of predicted toxin-antitoxin system